MATFLTIGHSNRTLGELIEMLRRARASLLIDVRTYPRSRTNPVFNIETLPSDLEKVQIGYQHWPALGGRRGKQPEIDPKLNGLWRVQSFHNYADYAMGETFTAALRQLVELGRNHRLVLMCSEAVWWRCHRRIITDYLLVNGHNVEHLMSPGHCEQAKLTIGAVKTPDGKVLYPAIETNDG